MRKCKSILLSVALMLALSCSLTYADGSESLGDPSIAIAEGTDVLVAGIGLQPQPGTINISIPAGVTVKQVLLYWAGLDTPVAGDASQIVVSGNDVTGTLIGGPTLVVPIQNSWATTYRADITGLALVTGPGNFSVEVGGLDYTQGPDGAGLLVIVDDGVGTTDIQLKDGSDFAFAFFAPPLNTTEEQTYTFAPAAVDRTANLDMFVGDTELNADRPNAIQITVGDAAPYFIDTPFFASDGSEWDSYSVDVTIPAGVDTVKVQVLSFDVGNDNPNLESSLTWVASAFSVPVPEEECTGVIGDLVWMDDPNCDGLQDGEPGIAGVIVRLLDENMDFITDTTTDENGHFLFEGLCAGTYYVSVNEATVPAGLSLAPSMVGDDENVDSNPNPAMVVLETNDDVDLSIDFGYCDLAEGCTPGYWKQPQHFDSWVVYSPNDNYDAVFGVTKFKSKTLLQVLSLGGGGVKALGRHSVAALLSAVNPDVDYAFTEAEVISFVQQACDTKDFEAIKNILAAENEAGCPLN